MEFNTKPEELSMGFFCFGGGFLFVLVWGNTGVLRRMEFFRGIASKLVCPIMEMIANALLEKLFSAKRW